MRTPTEDFQMLIRGLLPQETMAIYADRMRAIWLENGLTLSPPVGEFTYPTLWSRVYPFIYTHRQEGKEKPMDSGPALSYEVFRGLERKTLEESKQEVGEITVLTADELHKFVDLWRYSFVVDFPCGEEEVAELVAVIKRLPPEAAKDALTLFRMAGSIFLAPYERFIKACEEQGHIPKKKAFIAFEAVALLQEEMASLWDAFLERHPHLRQATENDPLALFTLPVPLQEAEETPETQAQAFLRYLLLSLFLQADEAAEEAFALTLETLAVGGTPPSLYLWGELFKKRADIPAERDAFSDPWWLMMMAGEAEEGVYGYSSLTLEEYRALMRKITPSWLLYELMLAQNEAQEDGPSPLLDPAVIAECSLPSEEEA